MDFDWPKTTRSLKSSLDIAIGSKSIFNWMETDHPNRQSNAACETKPPKKLQLRPDIAGGTIGQAGLHVTIVAALQSEVNFDQLGPLLNLAAERPFITGLSLQPATYSGRFFLPEELERRITFPDVIRGLCEQSQGTYREEDFFPLPCAHPNCHILSLAYRHVVNSFRSLDSSMPNPTSICSPMV